MDIGTNIYTYAKIPSTSISYPALQIWNAQPSTHPRSTRWSTRCSTLPTTGCTYPSFFIYHSIHLSKSIYPSSCIFKILYIYILIYIYIKIYMYIRIYIHTTLSTPAINQVVDKMFHFADHWLHEASDEKAVNPRP